MFSMDRHSNLAKTISRNYRTFRPCQPLFLKISASLIVIQPHRGQQRAASWNFKDLINSQENFLVITLGLADQYHNCGDVNTKLLEIILHINQSNQSVFNQSTKRYFLVDYSCFDAMQGQNTDKQRRDVL